MNCPVCGSENKKTLYPDTLEGTLPVFGHTFSPEHMRTYEIVKCLSCSHAYCITPTKNIEENYESVVDLEYLKREESRRLTSQKIINTINKFKPSGDLLDVGCATGDFLSIAQKSYSVKGLELSNWSANISESRGFTIYRCNIKDLPSSSRFDIITMFAVIEHFENPNMEINMLYNLLNPNGIICLWTGNIDSFTSKLLGKKWWYIQGQHIQFFSKNSLNRIFENNKFENIYMSTYPFTTNFESLSKSFYRYNSIKPLTKILEHKLLKNKTITLKIPGEMLAIYKKI